MSEQENKNNSESLETNILTTDDLNNEAEQENKNNSESLETNIVTTDDLNNEAIDVFDFIKSPEKISQLTSINNLLNITKHQHNKLVFVYSAPKVGSTSIVSSLRIFGIEFIDIIHIHDEEMLKVLANVNEVSINEIILFNKYLGKDVYVINIYRSPIERNISTYFEKIGCYHFNNKDEEVNKYNIQKIIDRFNNIFPWIGVGDHFIDKYNIKIPDRFDYKNKYIIVNENNINYITLRLKDSNEWGRILTNIFGFKIHIIKDYESSNKPIKYLYNSFKKQYKIPKNLLNKVLNDKYLKYYYSEDEINIYNNEWLNKSDNYRESYNYAQYKLYEQITIENIHIDIIQLDHYLDEGCRCKACSLKRLETISKIIRGIEVKDRIVHVEAKTELINKRVLRANKINHIISKLPLKIKGKDFKHEMTSIVSNGSKRF